MVPSLGKIDLFKGKMIALCGRVTNVPMITPATSTKEEFEIIRFVDNNAPFALLLGNTWIEKDHIRRKEEEAIEKKKQELRDFITRRIARLIEEQEDQSKQPRARELYIEVEKTHEDLKNLSMQERSIATPEIAKEGTLTAESLRTHQQYEVTLLREDKNKNGKRNPETQITEKKESKLGKKKAKLEKLWDVLEQTSQEADLQNLNLVRITEQRRMGFFHDEAI
jgi:hypothetical protein